MPNVTMAFAWRLNFYTSGVPTIPNTRENPSFYTKLSLSGFNGAAIDNLSHSPDVGVTLSPTPQEIGEALYWITHENGSGGLGNCYIDGLATFSIGSGFTGIGPNFSLQGNVVVPGNCFGSYAIGASWDFNLRGPFLDFSQGRVSDDLVGYYFSNYTFSSGSLNVVFEGGSQNVDQTNGPRSTGGGGLGGQPDVSLSVAVNGANGLITTLTHAPPRITYTKTPINFQRSVNNVDPPPVLGRAYSVGFATSQAPQPKPRINISLPLATPQASVTATATATAGGVSFTSSVPVSFFPVPVVAMRQQDSILTNGKWNYLNQVSFGSLSIQSGQGYPATVPAFRLIAPVNADGDESSFDPQLLLDAALSISPTSLITKYEWFDGAVDSQGRVSITDAAGFDPKIGVSTQTSTRRASIGLILSLADGTFVAFVAGYDVKTDTAVMSGVAHPSGALYLPLAGSGFSSLVVRLVEGVAPATLGAVPLKNVHLMRHEGILYAGGVASDGSGKLYESDDEGVTFTLLSQAFPAPYKTIGWCELWGGGFAAIATQGSGLYGAFSLDGQNWSTPKLLYTAPSGTPKGSLRQMTASGESHLIISDAQTYSIRNDDAFATAGTRLF